MITFLVSSPLYNSQLSQKNSLSNFLFHFFIKYETLVFLNAFFELLNNPQHKTKFQVYAKFIQSLIYNFKSFDASVLESLLLNLYECIKNMDQMNKAILQSLVHSSYKLAVRDRKSLLHLLDDEFLGNHIFGHWSRSTHAQLEVVLVGIYSLQ